MKKVMFYCHVFYPQESGYSNAFQNIINAILDNDINTEITVLTPFPLGGESEIVKERLKVVRLNPVINIPKIRIFLNDFFYASKVNNYFNKNNFDLLFVETFDQSIFLSRLNKKIMEKTVVRIHSTSETEKTFFYNRLDFLVRRFLIKNIVSQRVKWILSTNSFHIDFCKNHYFQGNLMKIADTNFFVLPNTIAINQPENYEIGNKLKIFVLGRMDYLGNNQKGFTDLIYALKLLPEDILNKLDFTIVGNGDMREYLMHMINDENVKFITVMKNSDIIEKLKDSDIIILPSRYEGLSMFALEGLSTGNACVFSKTGGLVDLIDGNGLFFEPQNIEGLADAIVTVAKKTNEEIVSMKKKSIRICEDKFSPKSVSRKFTTIYEIVTGKK
jgi:glycosyltransferase involved in cell wall biosynthesis